VNRLFLTPNQPVSKSFQWHKTLQKDNQVFAVMNFAKDMTSNW